MKLLNMFGLGKDKILANGEQTEAVVTSVKECWWLKVNTKAARMSGMDGARHPYIISFSYDVEGKEYRGKAFVNWNEHPPVVNGKVTICYNRDNPSNCIKM